VSRNPLTVLGAERLKRELKQLKSEERPQIIREIADARAHGDLRENAEYHAARERQGFIEARIAELEQGLARAELIDPSRLNAGGRVVFGATVELASVESGDEVTYQVVGEIEADIGEGRVSITSPVARALIGKREGDVVEVQAPAGKREYEILAVRYE